MPAANLIARGIGFSPGSVKYIVTAGLLAGVAATASSSGEHRLSNSRNVERQVAKKTYQSIDWSAPIFGETPKQVIPTPVVIPEPKRVLDYTEEQTQLSDIDREIQLLLKTVIAQEGTVAELKAIEQSILESQEILEAERFARKKRLALLLLLSAA